MDLSMGGYGFYVWGSYLLAFVAIGLEVFALSRRKKASTEGSEASKASEKGERNVSHPVPFAVANSQQSSQVKS